MGYLGGNDLSASCLLVTLIFSTLMLFPINVWIFEWKRNLSVPIGWTYFIGWVVLFLHATCGEWLRGPWEGGDVGGSGQRWCGEGADSPLG